MKYVRYTALLIFGLIWIAGCSSTIINELYRIEVIPDDYRYGDLYRLSNLKDFKDPKIKCPSLNLPKKRVGNKKIALYIIGDSFTEEQRISSSDFSAEFYRYAHWGTQLHLALDTSYYNVVLMETVERNTREHFNAPISNILPDTATFVTIPEDPRLVSRLDRLFSSNPTEDRLATLLFQFDFMLWIKEAKAWLNLYLFNRTDPKVTLSRDGATLAYFVDTDSSLINSSFIEVPDADIDSLVSVINTNEKYLQSLGFDQVWYSIIPNKATLLMPDYGNYNYIIERIGRHPELRVQEISVMEEFKTLPESPYLIGDSHWSCAGQHTWLRNVNRRLDALANKKVLRSNAGPGNIL